MQFDEIMKLNWRDVDRLLLQDGPKDCTWMKIRDYIEETYSQEQILKVNVFFWISLNEMDLESEEADELREVCEPWWYAMDDVELFNKEIDQYFRRDEKMS